MKITFLYGDAATEYECGEPETLLCAARHAGISLYAPCGGAGRCGGCRVIARGALSEPDGVERAALGEAELVSGVRLACRASAVGDCTVTVTDESGGVSRAASAKRIGTDRGAIGAAVDIGTTTVAASAVDMDTGERLSEVSALNPQSVFGADVISRISAAEKYGVGRLSKPIRECVGGLLRQLGLRDDVPRVIVGNTVMMSLYAGVDPSPIGRAPFRPETLFGYEADGAYLPRCVSGYFGADAVASVITAICDFGGDDFALADIGTNGEIAVMKDGVMHACAAAAGPALEGAGISCGMRAVAGAVDSVRIERGAHVFHVIGGGEPKGICGSGLIDGVACLLMTGAIDRDGKLDEPFRLADGVYMTEADVRSFQLAKAAIRAALGIAVGDKENLRLYLSGAFGSGVSVRSCVRTGLIPKNLSGDVRVIGNGALRGAELMLMRPEVREKAREIAESAVYDELSVSEAFSRKYIESMRF